MLVLKGIRAARQVCAQAGVGQVAPLREAPRTSPRPAAPGAARRRRDIDGLRAVAVLPVILFHAQIPGFSGGYLGVDVFFVISGFLITGILLRELAEGDLSFARFYARRARRILPALTVVLLATAAAGVAWLPPPQLADLSRGLIAAAASVSNILYWRELDYFGPAAEHLPLLHTWSLGVEEQFYLLFPLALAGLWRLRRARLASALWVAALASLAIAALVAGPHPRTAFFLLPFRGWELLAGALAAIQPLRRSGRRAAFGLALVAGAMAAAPLLPVVAAGFGACLGAALVLRHGAPGQAVARLLSHPVPVGIGLVSYSAYLWHQPVLVFARVRISDALPPAVALGLVALTLLLAWATWAWVERPFRRPGPAGPTLRRAGAATLGLVALGLFGLATDGLVQRRPEAERRILANVALTNPWHDRCWTDAPDPVAANPMLGCLLKGRGPGVAFLGDSHGDVLQAQIFAAAEAADWRFYSVTRSGCRPVPGLMRAAGPTAGSLACDAFYRRIYDYLIEDGFRVAVLTGRWPEGVAPAPFDNGEGGVDVRSHLLVPVGAGPLAPEERQAADIATYVGGVRRLLDAGMEVVLVYPIPEAGWNVPAELIRRRAASAVPANLSTPRAAYDARQQAVIAAFDAIDDPRLARVRPEDILCDTIEPGRCLLSLGDVPLYSDASHLNDAGVALVAPAIVRAISAARAAAGDVAMRP